MMWPLVFWLKFAFLHWFFPLKTDWNLSVSALNKCASLPRRPSSPAGWKWGLLGFWWSLEKTRVNTCGVKWPVRAFLQDCDKWAQGRNSAGSPLNFTASESPFSHLMSALTRPLISLETKSCLMEWGVAWKDKNCLSNRGQTEPTWTNNQQPQFELRGDFLRARLYFCALNCSEAQFVNVVSWSCKWRGEADHACPFPCRPSAGVCVLVCVWPEAQCFASADAG